MIVNLSAGQLAVLIGVISTLLPIVIGAIGVTVILNNISDKMTALEWTTLSKLTQHSLFSFYGAGGQPALMLYGVSAIAPLGIQTCTVMYNASVDMEIVDPDLLSRAVNNMFSLDQLSQIRLCHLCTGMKDHLHVDAAYLADFNKTYSSNAMRYRMLTTSRIGNISYPSGDFMMGVVTSTQTGYNIIDRMIVDHYNGGLLMNQAIQPGDKVGKKFNWAIEGMWLQPHVSCQSTNLTKIAWENKTGIFNWVAKMVIPNTNLQPPNIHPLGDKGQKIDLSSRSIKYSQLIQSIIIEQMNMTTNGNFLKSSVYKSIREPKTIETFDLFFFLRLDFNSTLESDMKIRCAGFGYEDNVADNIVGVKCWTLLGPPKITERGVEQILYACAGAVEASVKVIELQSDEQKQISVLYMQTIPAHWYIEKANNSISYMDPWWGGVKFGEKIPNNSILVSNNSLWLPTGKSFSWGTSADAQTAGVPGTALNIITDFSGNDIYGYRSYRGDGIRNLALLQQWKEEGTSEEGINRMFQRQWTDIVVNMVFPTSQTKVTGPIQFMMHKTCYDMRFAMQYYIAIIGLIIILCVELTNHRRNSLTRIKQIIRQMDLGRAILNTQAIADASTADSSEWVKADGKKLLEMGKAGFI
ncbi:14468_t:CDS:2 [Ambispora leptoticha]|uniref:14468_t:CDS:1 n=1 Tax=Ambispora leptoticha TaxID=144679 RepID=A0A9N9BD13_9GLOM|nr:14468_t:CDS:2 [Ambispora leptoticha]